MKRWDNAKMPDGSLLLPTLLSYDFLHPTYQLLLSAAVVYVGAGNISNPWTGKKTHLSVPLVT